MGGALNRGEGIPAASYAISRSIAIAAVSTCIRHDAVDLLPMLFAPVGSPDGRCPHCHYADATLQRHHSPTCPRR